MQPYDVDVKYRPGKSIPIPDTLSRKPLPDTAPELSEKADIQVNLVMSNVPVSDRKMQEIRKKTDIEPQMVTLKQTILFGWPNTKKECPPSLIDYWCYRDELTVVDGIIMKGHKIVIPPSLRKQMLEIVHTGHFGVDKCLSRARTALFWPNISHDIKQLVLKCPICIEHRASNPKEPLKSHDIPEYPWQIVATDLFTWDDKNYIVVVDYYSHYFEVKELPNLKSVTIITKMKGIFARMGIPEVVVSDNGPCYRSAEFANFARTYDFIHRTSSPHHPSGNGFAEAYVKICKKILTKAKVSKSDPFLSLLEYRSTPLDCGYSPSELLMGRQLKSIIPTTKSNLLPKLISPEIVQAKLSAKKTKDKFFF